MFLMMSILPTVSIGSYRIPVLYSTLPILGVIIFFMLMGWIKRPPIVNRLVIMFTIIYVQVTLSTLISTVTRLGTFEFPSDILQYVARFSVIIFMVIWFYNRKISGDTFIKYFLLFLCIGMLIGILQWIPWPGREFFVKLYPFRDGSLQLSHLNRSSLASIRVHGMAQHATSNGGLGMFFFIFGFTVFKYYGEFKKRSVVLIIFSVVNVFASQARSGILSLVFGVTLIFVIDFYLYKKSIKPLINLLISFIVSSFLLYILLLNENAVVLNLLSRLEIMFEPNQGGSIRIDQFRYFLTLFESPVDYIGGLSKPIINNSAISYGVEIEPFNIFVTYGILGFILQYGLIIYILLYLVKNITRFKSNRLILTLIIFSFVGLLSYQVFSLAYFFFRETQVGLFPWIVLGVTIGLIEKEKVRKEIKNE